MSKLSIGRHGIQVETHEKANVMSSFNHTLWLVIPCLVLLSYNEHCRIFSLFCIIGVLFLWGAIYSFYSIKSPELLQSEKYRLENHRIEAGMITNKNGKSITNEILTTNIQPLLKTDNREDIQE